MKKQKLSSGEIANICKINKKTLFYYDQINLFKPAVIEANGYRYYTLDQIDQLSKIKALQSVGFSLAEIKQQMEGKELSEGLKMLHQQKQKIEEKANELLAVKEMLGQKILELEHYNQIGIHRIFKKEYSEQWLHVDELLSQTNSVTNFLLDGHHFGIILTVTDGLTENTKVTKYQQVADVKVANFKKEKGSYAGLYFTSDEHHILANALQALAMLKNNGHSISGYAYVKDIASDFVNFQNGEIPFQITMQVKNS
ncbi:MerR family transcriptional regulator [Planococcus sp. YIM B11945]|uniref:MerR family transcriptional regulator n=1 Tax=Planococcus sp. YIM B11945 TaxID=3435410 RepID=UPI003D7F0A2F